MNLHALALALRPPVTAGDVVRVNLIKAGKEPGQAVGYLDDGTMVVAERSRERIGQDVAVVVTSVLTTANGRMVFSRPQTLVSTAVSAAVTRRAPSWWPPAPAAGSAPGRPKAFVPLAGVTLLEHAVSRLPGRRRAHASSRSCPDALVDEAQALLGDSRRGWWPAAATRQDSVAAGLAALPADVDVVLVHDAARCLAPPDAGRAGWPPPCAAGSPAVVPGLPVVDTVKEVDAPAWWWARSTGRRCAGCRRRRASTRALLERAHAAAGDSAGHRRRRAGRAARACRCGSSRATRCALKVTTPQDLALRRVAAH